MCVLFTACGSDDPAGSTGPDGPNEPLPEEIPLTSDGASWLPFEVATLSASAGAVLVPGVYDGVLDETPIRAVVLEDSATVALVMPPLAAGSHTLEVDFGDAYGVADMTAAAPPAIAQPEVEVRDWTGDMRAEIAAIQMRLDGLIEGNFSPSMDLLNQLADEVDRQLATATEAELREAALLMRANPDLFSIIAIDSAAVASPSAATTPEERLEEYKQSIGRLFAFSDLQRVYWAAIDEDEDVFSALGAVLGELASIGKAISIGSQTLDLLEDILVMAGEEITGDITFEETSPRASVVHSATAPGDTLEFPVGRAVRLSLSADYRTLYSDDLDDLEDYGPTVRAILSAAAALEEFFLWATDEMGIPDDFTSPLVSEHNARIEHLPVHGRYVEVLTDFEQYGFTHSPDEATGDLLVEFSTPDGRLLEDYPFTLRLEYNHAGSVSGDVSSLPSVATSTCESADFIVADWILRYYTDDTRTELRQDDYQTFHADGTWTQTKSYSYGNEAWSYTQTTGTWSYSCANNQIFWTHDYYETLDYRFDIDPDDPNLLIGYSVGLSYNGYDLALIRQ